METWFFLKAIFIIYSIQYHVSPKNNEINEMLDNLLFSKYFCFISSDSVHKLKHTGTHIFFSLYFFLYLFYKKTLKENYAYKSFQGSLVSKLSGNLFLQTKNKQKVLYLASNRFNRLLLSKRIFQNITNTTEYLLY